jgi:hypothetical protein
MPLPGTAAVFSCRDEGVRSDRQAESPMVKATMLVMEKMRG